MGLAVGSRKNVRVHVASRDVLTNAGLRQLLRSCSFISVTGATSGEEATVSAVQVEQPDVLVLHASIEQDVHSIVRATRAISASLKIVVLTDEVLAARLMATAQIRLEGILVRGGEYLQDIGAVLRIVHHGGQVSSTSGASTPHPGPRPVDAQLAARLESLLPREAVVLRELARGRTNAEIAGPLHVSVATIKADVARVMGALGAFSRVDLAVLAVRSGFLDETARQGETSQPRGPYLGQHSLSPSRVPRVPHSLGIG